MHNQPYCRLLRPSEAHAALDAQALVQARLTQNARDLVRGVGEGGRGPLRGEPAADRGLDERGAEVSAKLRIAFVGTYPPRRCGIATFTPDLAQAVGSAGEQVPPMTLALSDAGEQYEYPPEVGYEIRQGVKGDYARAAEFLNYSDVRLVSIQHEHGIFGGEDGAYVLDLVSGLHIPAVATLHTVLKDPSDSQRSVIEALSRKCARLVVMSRVAADLLRRSYGIGGRNVQIIPHGIPVMHPRDQQGLKTMFGVPGRRMLLTFGLLGPGKGIETVRPRRAFRRWPASARARWGRAWVGSAHARRRTPVPPRPRPAGC